MVDDRVNRLAKQLVNYSCNVQKGEKVLISTIDCDDALTEAMIKAVAAAGGIPFVDLERSSLLRQLLMNGSKAMIDAMTKFDVPRMKDMDAFIGIRGASNVAHLSDVPPDIME